MKYDVTITRTGSVTVDANSAEEALEKVSEMSTSEIEEHAQLTGWEVSDAELLDNEDEDM